MVKTSACIHTSAMYRVVYIHSIYVDRTSFRGGGHLPPLPKFHPP